MLKPVKATRPNEETEAGVIRLDTLPDIVRKLRRITEELGASHFATCFVTPRPGRRQLVPCLDARYPATAEQTRLLAVMLGDRFARRVAASSVPLWWAKTGTPRVPTSATLHVAERIEAPAGSLAGLALPTAIEHGPEGVILFTGDEIRLSADALCDVHARCVGLFSIIAKLRPVNGHTAPSISKRELECLILTANGLTSEEIAEKLGLSVHTANQYLTNTTRKLNAVNRMQAVAKALRMGLFD